MNDIIEFASICSGNSRLLGSNEIVQTEYIFKGQNDFIKTSDRLIAQFDKTFCLYMGKDKKWCSGIRMTKITEQEKKEILSEIDRLLTRLINDSTR